MLKLSFIFVIAAFSQLRQKQCKGADDHHVIEYIVYIIYLQNIYMCIKIWDI